jgi:hypothetical protein
MKVLSASLVGFVLGLLTIVVGAQQSFSYRSLSVVEAIGVKGGQSCSSGCCHLDNADYCSGGTNLYCEDSTMCSGGEPGMGIPPWCAPETTPTVEYFTGSWRSCHDNYSQGKDCESLGEVPCEMLFSCSLDCIPIGDSWQCETDPTTGMWSPGEENNKLVGDTNYCV